MKVMVSACLLGDDVKYNGKNNYNESLVEFLKDKHCEIIKICPEIMGGLPIIRSIAERKGDSVINIEGKDVTQNFKLGANKALQLAKENNISVAILKKNSPSCGVNTIYDGTFSHKVIAGDGITAEVLKKNGILVYHEENYKEYRW